MSREPAYPFEPRSTSFLRPGQFWAVPLSDGRFGCGRVLAVKGDPSDPYWLGTSRIFLAGLMDWNGSGEPTSSDLAESSPIAQGMAHVSTIQQTGGLVLGWRDLADDGIVGLREISHRSGGSVYLYEGPTCLRVATEEEQRSLPVRSTWGYKVIQELAELSLVRGEPLM